MPARYATVLVEGDSMLPTYSSGDWLLARWGRPTRGISVDSVVVIELEGQPGIFYIKRVSKIDRDKQELYLLSDNPAGTDSRQWGWLSLDSVKAKVLFRVRELRKSSSIQGDN
jgi:phage repressor protein C with HTH and peptisase S24 domain